MGNSCESARDNNLETNLKTARSPLSKNQKDQEDIMIANQVPGGISKDILIRDLVKRNSDSAQDREARRTSQRYEKMIKIVRFAKRNSKYNQIPKSQSVDRDTYKVFKKEDGQSEKSEALIKLTEEIN